jgi:D-lactate dehydrogenase
MKVTVFDTHEFDRQALIEANNGQHEFIFLKVCLDAQTAMLAKGSKAVCCFTNDRADESALKVLAESGVRLMALRSAGYNQVDLKCASRLGIVVVRVPEYSPYAVAEFAVGLLQTLNRKIHKALNRVHDMNFSLDGLIGFDLHGKTVGVIGTGKIGKIFARIMSGFGCRVLAYDKDPDPEWAIKNDVEYRDLKYLLSESLVLSLHVPLNAGTRHLIDAAAFAQMKKNVILINTGRGALVDTKALIKALKTHSIGGACLDVYEEEVGVFFSDMSESGIDDDVLARLLTFPNVLVTSHQAFLTNEALANIAMTTVTSLTAFENGGDLSQVRVTD